MDSSAFGRDADDFLKVLFGLGIVGALTIIGLIGWGTFELLLWIVNLIWKR